MSKNVPVAQFCHLTRQLPGEWERKRARTAGNNECKILPVVAVRDSPLAAQTIINCLLPKLAKQVLELVFESLTYKKGDTQKGIAFFGTP